jgi:hypothetical protein
MTLFLTDRAIRDELRRKEPPMAMMIVKTCAVFALLAPARLITNRISNR